ncbi:MAG: hypothetical protein II575_08480, partial [Bacteroidales bacterium]|nr:hypothetical protein [Bacteroidales bacterium]
DETSASYYQYNDTEEVRLGKERSAMVKDAVVRLSQYHAELAAMEASGAGEDAIRKRFEECYDLQSLLSFFVFSQYISENGDCTLSIVNCQLKNLFTLLVFGNAVFYLCAEFKEETIWQETFSIGMCGARKKATFSIVTYYCNVCMGLCININNLYA